MPEYEDWQLDFEWLKVRHQVKEKFNRDKLPDLNAILFLIGIQELGKMQQEYTKEEKQDLMHIAVCRLLSERDYFEFEGIDTDGWPHWKALKPIKEKGVEAQSRLLKECIIHFFNRMEIEDLPE